MADALILFKSFNNLLVQMCTVNSLQNSY